VGSVAGCFVTDGKITRNLPVRLVRDNVVIYTGRMASLRRFKDDVREVRDGFECGIKVEGYDDIKVGDVIEAFEVQEFARTVT
jgi:translation initiation factor IF-2